MIMLLLRQIPRNYICIVTGPAFSTYIQTDRHYTNIYTEMINVFLLEFILLGWVPLAFGLSNAHLARTKTAAPVVSYVTSMAHSAYMGKPTVTGALNASSTLGANISSLGVAPSATTYPSDGKLHDPAPAPFFPAGGVGTNGTTPVYNAKSDFDFESLVCLFHSVFLYIVDERKLTVKGTCSLR